MGTAQPGRGPMGEGAVPQFPASTMPPAQTMASPMKQPGALNLPSFMDEFPASTMPPAQTMASPMKQPGALNLPSFMDEAPPGWRDHLAAGAAVEIYSSSMQQWSVACVVEREDNVVKCVW